MEFVTGLPRTGSSHNVIWVIVDRMTKLANFLAVKTTDSVNKLVGLYIQEIVKLYSIPVSVASNRDPHFTFQFWISF